MNGNGEKHIKTMINYNLKLLHGEETRRGGDRYPQVKAVTARIHISKDNTHIYMEVENGGGFHIFALKCL